MSRTRATLAVLACTALLAGCRIDAGPQAAPEGYHRMPDGTLMADVAMQTEYRDVGGNGVELATHTRPDGTVVLGPAPDHAGGDHAGHGGHDHAVPDPADFPQGIVPVRLLIPRIGVDASVVATRMTAGAIQGPPVAGDVAWLEQTRRPGEIGPAVIGGVDALDDSPGAFARLGEMAPGDEFVLVSDEGDLFAYRVETTRRTPVADRGEVFRAGGAEAEVRLVDWALDGEAHDHVVTAVAIGPIRSRSQT